MITAAFPVENRKRKTPLFQPFMVKNQTNSLPMKQLDGRARAVHDDKNLSAQRIPSHIPADNARQGIETFAHILT
jgi:hypothetical protein